MTQPQQPRARPCRYSLEQLLEYVDTYHGAFAIGFKAASEADRAQTRRGSSRHEHLGENLAKNVVASDNIAAVMLGRLLPLHLLASAVQEFTGSMRLMHCEAAFYLSAAGRAKFGDDFMLAVATQQKAPVFLYPRRFNDEYEWLNVRADCNQLRCVLGYCQKLQGQPFKYGAMAQCLTTPGPDTRQKWYCSYLCATLLEFLDVPDGHLNRPNTLSIDDLYHIVSAPAYRPENDYSRPAAHLKKLYNSSLLAGYV